MKITMATVSLGTLILAVFVTTSLKTADAEFCYECDHVAHPRDCPHTKKCAAGEKCYATAFALPDGHFYYKIGCMAGHTCPSRPHGKKRDIAFCNLCCDGDYCNKELCDTKSKIPHGPRCLKCQTVEHPSHCNVVTECNMGQSCYSKGITVFGEKRFELGCADTQGCHPTSTFNGKRDLSSVFSKRAQGGCISCCSGSENCNNDLTCQFTSGGSSGGHQTPMPTSGGSGVTHINHVQSGCFYQGHMYGQDQTWYDGCQYNCTCVEAATGRYICHNLCPMYVHIPTWCKMVTEPGECCAKPVCNGTMTTSNLTFSADHCVYKGKTHKQGEIWTDGCDYECTCIDSTRGWYRCSDRCYTWNLPPACHLNPPKPGKCCKTPSCPAHYTIRYPKGYKEN